MNKTTFWQLLIDHSVIIPIIQRDYAQGRKGKEFIRKNFLEQIMKGLFSSNGEEKCEMDFVYGTVKDKALYPIDGQQRLTTLWLFHWYVAWKEGKLDNGNIALLKKFSYETRSSSREFCEKLCDFAKKPEEVSGSVVDAIENETWFYSEWKQDPTIQSMCRMLRGTKDNQDGSQGNFDGIEEVYNSVLNKTDQLLSNSIFEKLTSENCPLHFSLLKIGTNELPVSDDLYIKMNARGKALTSFENFKAGLVDYIHKKANQTNDDENKWKELDSVEHGFGQKLDNAWTDVFWNLRSKDDSAIPERQNRIDEIFFVFFNRFFFNYQASHADSELWKISPLYGNSGKDETVFFSSLKNYSIKPCQESVDIPLEVFEQISTVLNNWTELAKAINKDKNPPLGPSWDEKSFLFLPEYEKNEYKKLLPIIDEDGNDILKITNIKLKQRVVFFAVCQWLLHNEPSADSRCYSQDQKEHFEDWMRVIWNIVENSETDNNLWGALNLINEMAENGSHDILTSLTSEPTKVKSNFAQDIRREEQLKAKIIVEERKKLRSQNISPRETLEYLIKSMESHPFIHGDIPVQMYMPEGGNINRELWSKRHNNLVKSYLGKNGQLEQGKYQFSKDLLMHINDYKQLEICFMDGSFLFNQTNYHRLIRHPDICKVIAEMLDGTEGHLFSWPGHEFTCKRIIQRLAKRNTLDAFCENGYKETRLQWISNRLYLHQKCAWYGYHLLNSPLYDILEWLEKNDKIKIPDDQKWSGIFNSDPVAFLFQGKIFKSDGSDGINIWTDEYCDSRMSLFSDGENPIEEFPRWPACDFSEKLAAKFLVCCQNIYNMHYVNIINQNNQRG